LEPFEKAGHRVSGPFRGYKMDAWDGGHHLPFIARWPGVVQPGSQCAQLTSHCDLMATCAEITGAKIPGNAGEDSFSILPLLQGGNHSICEAVVTHSAKGMFAIQRGEWKLIVGQGSGSGHSADTGPEPGQLYDTPADLGETNNLYAQHPEIVAELTALLKRYVEDGRSTPGSKQKNDVPVNWNKKSPPAKRGGKAAQTPDA
jgi:arylsulfatase A-like enzyme